jgi:uncharacterized protein YukE
MSDIYMNHSAVSEIKETMAGLGRQMMSQIDDCVQQLDSLKASFEGATADQFRTISQQRSQMHQELVDYWTSGSNVLDDIHQGMISADQKAASIIQ